MLPTQAEIDQIRADAKTMLPNTGRVLAHTSTPDGSGGQTESYTPGSELPCAIAPIRQGGASRVTGEQLDEASTHITTWPHDTVIRDRDRVRINGVDYAVTARRERGALTFTRRVEVKEV